jgi:hypothetical protein
MDWVKRHLHKSIGKDQEMSAVVSLRDIVEEMDLQNEQVRAFLNQCTGEIIMLFDEDIHLIEGEDDWSKYPEEQQQALAITKEVLDSEDTLPLPSPFEIHEYAIMERFCHSIDDPAVSDRLTDQIKGSGAFRRFKEAIRRYNLTDEWHQFRNKALEEIAIDWLKSHGIAFTRPDAQESA